MPELHLLSASDLHGRAKKNLSSFDLNEDKTNDLVDRFSPQKMIISFRAGTGQEFSGFGLYWVFFLGLRLQL